MPREETTKADRPNEGARSSGTTDQRNLDDFQRARSPSYVSDLSKEMLDPRQWHLYCKQFAALEDWMGDVGKDPAEGIGLAETTVKYNSKRLDQLHRWSWNNITSVTQLRLTQEVADEICNSLYNDDITKQCGDPYSVSSKRKLNDSLRKYFEWRVDERGGEEWSPPHEFEDGNHRPADYFTVEERSKLRNAVLTYDSLPSYSDCTPEQREQLKTYLAQRLGKQKELVTPEDWRQHNRSWERTSLMWTALDAGLRPIEVHRAINDWLRLDKQSLYIPKEDSSKNRDNWEVALREETAEILELWLEERAHLPKYNDTNKLWLTREGNPWGSASLNYLLRVLCAEAEIDITNRKIVWYSIRHSVGQHLTEKGGLEKAKEQLRHKNIESTLTYQTPSLQSRRDDLDKMG